MKATEFVGSTALAAQNTHTHLHVPMSSCTHTMKTAVSVQKWMKFHIPSIPAGLTPANVSI